MARAQHYLVPCFIIALTFLEAGAVIFGAGQPLRGLAAFAFLSICPGMSLLYLAGIARGIWLIVIGVALSLALEMIASEVMVYACAWSADGALAALMGLTVMASLASILDRERGGILTGPCSIFSQRVGRSGEW